ncbi:MAG: hypothetical protein Q9221_003296 [Calogaya cf. arnoldii]
MKNIKSSPAGGTGLHHKSYHAFQEAIAHGCVICHRFQRLQRLQEITILEVRLSLSYRYGYEYPGVEDGLENACLPDGKVQLCLDAEEFEIRDTVHGRLDCAESLSLNLVPIRSEASTVTFGKHGETLLHSKGDKLPNSFRALNTDSPECLALGRTFEAWQTAIPDEALIPTFKDALKVTRSLGLRYLWIDSLCIIQDSKRDWLYQSSRMSNVYMYAHCSITATASESDASGLFRTRDPLINLPVRFDFTDIVCDLTDDRKRNTLEGAYNIHLKRTWFYKMDMYAPLAQRAWVVQERLLAPRVLHFAETQLYWECNEFQACESWPEGMPQEDYTHIDLKANNPFSLQRELLDNNVESAACGSSSQLRRSFNVWGQIVQAYSQGRLTLEGDKIVAISALARAMKPLMQCRYLAGHWETDLIRQLGWPGYDVHKRASRYRAPSWAWTSMDGRNQFFYRMYDSDEQYYPLAEVLHAHVDLATEDEFGLIEGGYLKVRGKLFPAVPQEESEKEREAYFVSRGAYSSGEPLVVLGMATNLRFHQDGIEPKLEGLLYIMPLSLEFDVDDFEVIFHGLMLQPTGVPDEYQRVGSVEPGIGEPFPKDDTLFPLLGKIENNSAGDKSFSRDEADFKTFKIV